MKPIPKKKPEDDETKKEPSLGKPTPSDIERPEEELQPKKFKDTPDKKKKIRKKRPTGEKPREGDTPGVEGQEEFPDGIIDESEIPEDTPVDETRKPEEITLEKAEGKQPEITDECSPVEGGPTDTQPDETEKPDTSDTPVYRRKKTIKKS